MRKCHEMRKKQILFKLFWIFFFALVPHFSLFSECSIQNSSLQQKAQHDSRPLALKEAILKNLLQQPAIRVALYNIDIQQGIAQSSAAPFDPVVNAQVFHTYSRDLIDIDQNVNSLNLGQNLNPIAGIAGANTLAQVPVNTTVAQQLAQCSCPSSDGSCGKPSSVLSPCPPAVHTDFQANEKTVHIDMTKKMREGTRILFSLDIDQYHNPIYCPKSLNVGRATFEVDQPLLRDRANGLDYMTERANLQEIEAIRYETLQTISEQILRTVNFYWDTLTGKKVLQAQRESEERLKEIVEKVKFLIQKEQLAPADLVQPIAQLAAQVVNRVQAEQTYYEAQENLKFAMGELDEAYPCCPKEFELSDDFPSSHINPLDFSTIFCRFFPGVYQQRFDILASSTREAVYLFLLKGAKNLELPRLDLVARASVTDFSKCSKASNLVSSFEFKHPQQDYTVGVVFSTPFYRDEAKGLIKQRQAQWAQTQARTQLLRQQTINEISSALKDQINLQHELQKGREAVDEYWHLIINERKKLFAGYSSLFILLNFEASLTTATVNYIQLQGQLAKNIARIRFLTGTLIKLASLCNSQNFTVEDAMTLPFSQEGYFQGSCEGEKCYD